MEQWQQSYDHEAQSQGGKANKPSVSKCKAGKSLGPG